MTSMEDENKRLKDLNTELLAALQGLLRFASKPMTFVEINRVLKAALKAEANAAGANSSRHHPCSPERVPTRYGSPLPAPIPDPAWTGAR